MHMGFDRVAKRLDNFLVNDGIIQALVSIKQWVGEPGFSNYFPIMMDLMVATCIPSCSFKFFSSWMDE